MMIVEGGDPTCEKCNSYRIYNGVCTACGTNQLVYKRQKMVDNLLKYGFEEIKPSGIFTFFDRFTDKKRLSKYNYNGIIATHINDSPNMTFHIDDDEVIFNSHGDYKYVKEKLDKLLQSKEVQREIKLKKLLS